MNMYRIITGNHLSEEIYLQTWKLDIETFEENDWVTKEKALEWFYASHSSTIVLWNDEKNEMVGYLAPFLLKHDFASQYIISDKNYKESINKEQFCDIDNEKSGDIYIFSTVIQEKYRDIVIEDSKTAFQLLNEAFVDWIYCLQEKGIKIEYIFAETYSHDGLKYIKSLNMKKCFTLGKDAKYAKKYSPKMFYRCSNVQKLIQNNDDQQYDQSILDNHEYLSIRNNELYYFDINLHELALKYTTPLEVAYTPMITKKIKDLKRLFKEKINKYHYPSEYHYAYATKANYYSEVILTALKDIDYLETSSAYDIEIIIRLAQLHYLPKGYIVIANGFKNEKYIQAIQQLLSLGINVIPIIENKKELRLLCKLKEFPMNVGIRYNSDFESRLVKNDFSSIDEYNNRFGFDEDEIYEIVEEVEKQPHLTFKVFHFHFGGSIQSIENYIKCYANIFEIYCNLKKKCKHLEYFDFGGGFPVKYDLSYEFDYDKLVDEIVYTSQLLSSQYHIDAPQLIGEHGRYTSADASFYIYKIDFYKKTNNENWYIINGSLMNMTPDIWGISQDFTILPINLMDQKAIEVILGGETCDPDDRYYLKDRNIKLKMPQIKENQDLYIAIFSVGAYQRIISGIGGVHHCMIPEGKKITIYENQNGQLEIYEVKSQKDALSILYYDDESYINRFVNRD
ncbi:MAG: hypothetical protein ACI4U3_06285 [Traorella sp.]